MAVVALTSASGAPGVTTTALAMVLVWPRPVLLVEADVSGSSDVLAGYLRGAVSPAGRSLLGVAIGHRQDRLETALQDQTVPLDEAGTRRLVPAVPDSAQAVSLEPVWGPLATAFSSLERDGIDVVVDAGRSGALHGPEPLLRSADLVLLVTRTHLPAVASARARAGHLRAALGSAGSADDRLGLLLVGDGRPYTGQEISEATGLPILAAMAWDPTAAEVLSVGAPRPRRWEQSAYVRGARAAVDVVATRLSQHEAPPAAVVHEVPGNVLRPVAPSGPHRG